MSTTLTKIDPVQALLDGRIHYRRMVPDPRGEPTLRETIAAQAAECEGRFEAVASQGGKLIGYRCIRCGVTANKAGRTEYGPRRIERMGRGKRTLLEEPRG